MLCSVHNSSCIIIIISLYLIRLTIAFHCFVKRTQEDQETLGLAQSLTTARCLMTHFNSPGEWTMIIPKSDSNSVDALLGIYTSYNNTYKKHAGLSYPATHSCY